MPDDHSKLVPLLPIPNRTVKRLSADDSAGSRVKVGHCQALTASKSPSLTRWAFCFWVPSQLLAQKNYKYQAFTHSLDDHHLQQPLHYELSRCKQS